jgi:TRAP-type C4-dicarboxylate transport system permease small subunit
MGDNMARRLGIFRQLSALPVFLASAALFFLMVMTFLDVILRSTLNAPIEAATELTRILMAIIVFSVMPIISVRGEQIAVDLTDKIFDHLRLARLRDGILYIVCGGMLYWPIQRVWVLAERARDYGDVTEYLAIPQYLVGWFIAVAAAITAISMVLTGFLTLFAPTVLERSS